MKLQVLPLGQGAFSIYGDVIEARKWDFFHINSGLAERYHDLALAKIFEQDRTSVSISRVQPANLSLTIHELERHPLGIQASTPMKSEVFVVVVTLGDDKPNLSALRAFITNGEQGVNYYRNAWHRPLFTWQRVTNSLIIDRGDSDNYDVESIPEQELCFA